MTELFDRETLISILTNRIGYTMEVGTGYAGVIEVDQSTVEDAREIAEALLDQELSDPRVLKSLLGQVSAEDLQEEIRQSLVEILEILVKT